MRYAVAFGGAVICLALLAMFVRALPQVERRAYEGERRPHEAACEILRATSDSPALGELPLEAPNFSLKDFSGHEVSLSSLRGEVVLVNFWATWCKTCAVEMPSMERLVGALHGRPFRLLAVSVDEDWPVVRNFFPHGTVLPILLDAKKEVAQTYGVSKFPESFLIDRHGKLRYYVVSDRKWDLPEVKRCIEALMVD